METTLTLTVSSDGEFMKGNPPLKIAVITSENRKLSIAFELSVEDIQLSKEEIKELIKALTDSL